MHSLRVIVTTCKPYYWAIRPFSFLFNRYWSEQQPVVIAGYEPLDIELVDSQYCYDNFSFLSIDANTYPANRWSDGIIKLLHRLPDDYFVWMLEDMWLNRLVDWQSVESLAEYARGRDDILRIDLTTDRLYAHDPRYIPRHDRWGRIDIIASQPDWPYHVSLQAGIWNRSKLLAILQPGMTPWEFELQGQARLAGHSWQVLGTRQIPLSYALTLRGPTGISLDGLHPDDLDDLRQIGYV